jgi:hypothetical protein
MIWGAAAVASVPEPKAFGKGLIFVEDTDILLSRDKWTIAGNIALVDCNTCEPYEINVEPHSSKNTSRKEHKVILFYIHWEELNSLNKIFAELEDDSKSFRKLLFEETAARNRVQRAIEIRESHLIFCGTD